MNLKGMLAVVAVVLAMAGCSGGSECEPCPVEGCTTLDQALDGWVLLIQCCVRLNQDEFKPDWKARWKNIPGKWFEECVGRVTCTRLWPEPTDCSDLDDPIVWGDTDEMDACLLVQARNNVTGCSGNTLTMCVDGGGSAAVDCTDFCGAATATCIFEEDGLAKCSCGFPIGDGI